MKAGNRRFFKQDCHNQANGMDVHVHISYYYDTEEALY